MTIPGLDTDFTNAQVIDPINTETEAGKDPENAIETSTATNIVGSEAPTEQPSLATTERTIKLCGICKTQEYKYKCSRCYLPYCSLTCATQHKTTHPADEPYPNPTNPQETPAEASAKTGNLPQAGTIAAAGQKSPFAILSTSPELIALFKQFPNLPSQLNTIDVATLRPIDQDFGGGGGGKQRFGRTNGFGGGGGHKREEPWNPDRGLQKGILALQAARRKYGKDGEGVREYGELVLQLLARDEEMDAERQIQIEIAEENARVIRQLLDGER